MKTQFHKLFFLAALCSFFIYATNPTENQYTLGSDYSVMIHGTSNLHSWDEKVETVSGEGVVNWNQDGSFDLTTLTIKMLVLSIKSGKSVMDSKTYKAMKADKNPHIIFKLESPLRSIKAKKNEGIITAKGKLTIAGVTKHVDVKVIVFMPDQGKLVFEGLQIIKMTDYEVTPPTAILGTLKTGNEIMLNYKTLFLLKTN